MKIGSLRRRTSGAATPSQSSRQHKFAVGQSVTLMRRAGEPQPKDIEKDFLAAYQITRLLPEQDCNFQYRVKDAATGRERVVGEDQMALAS